MVKLGTMPGVKNLIRYQQNIAAESGIAFWNMFEAMGGEGSTGESRTRQTFDGKLRLYSYQLPGRQTSGWTAL